MNPSKHEVRKQMARELRATTDRESKSRLLFSHLFGLPQYAEADSVLLYAHIRNEVQTTFAIQQVWADGKQLVLPRCEGDELVLYLVRSETELSPGAFGIPEPCEVVRNSPGRIMSVSAIDLLCIPGVAFDFKGNRLGRGKGYYDRLLTQASPQSAIFGIAFDCQLLPTIPSEPHDRPMHGVVTESGAKFRQNR